MDYTGKLAYSADIHNRRKDGKLTYYRMVSFDGENITIEPLKHLPIEEATPYGAGNQGKCWDVHDLDILSEEYNLIYIGKDDTYEN